MIVHAFQDEVHTVVIVDGGYIGFSTKTPEDEFDSLKGIAIALLKMKRDPSASKYKDAVKPPYVNSYRIHMPHSLTAEIMLVRAELEIALRDRKHKLEENERWSSIFGERGKVIQRPHLIEIFARRLLEISRLRPAHVQVTP